MGFTAVQNSKPVGAIETAPIATTTLKGYLYCDGASYLRSDYPLLFAAIGTAHGAADGTHFNVPDYRGVFIRGHADGQATDPDRATRSSMNSGGSTGDNVGSMQGSEFESHDHTMSATPSTGLVSGGSTIPATGYASIFTTDVSGGNETRPVNAYSKFFIRY